MFHRKGSNKKDFFIEKKTDHSNFSHAKKNETLFSAIVNLLHKAEDNTLSKKQETMEFKTTIPEKLPFLPIFKCF